MQGYLRQVAKGEKKIASGALKPHELVEEAMRCAMQPQDIWTCWKVREWCTHDLGTSEGCT